MRRLLVERARRKRRARYGGGRARIDLENLDVEAERRAGDILALDQALERLTAEEPMAAEVVKLRYFAGLTAEEAAAADSGQLERGFACSRVRPARVRDLADAARRLGITRARMSQIADLALLPVAVQERVLAGEAVGAERKIRRARPHLTPGNRHSHAR